MTELPENGPDEKDFIEPKVSEINRLYAEHIGKIAKPRNAQWKDQAKRSVFLELWRCHIEKRPPEIELIVLTGAMFGKRYEWSREKYDVLNHAATKYCTYDPDKDDLPKGFYTDLARRLEEGGGIHQNPRSRDSSTGHEGTDYRKTIKAWLKDPLFKELYKLKAKQFQTYLIRKRRECRT